MNSQVSGNYWSWHVKNRAQEGEQGGFINFRKLREADPAARNKDNPR
jgi:hypothetical protein